MADEDPMRTSLKRVAVTLKSAGVPFALAGGYAAWVRGGPEPDHDVDFVVPDADIERALEVLAAEGFRVERPPEDWLAKVYDGNGDAEVMVDLIHRPNDRDVVAEMVDRADELPVESVTMPVQTPTDVLVSKLLAFTETYCDYTRSLQMARSLREQVDWAALRRETASSPYAAAFLHLVGQLGIAPAS